jgi:hypothetical protein
MKKMRVAKNGLDIGRDRDKLDEPNIEYSYVYNCACAIPGLRW